ncbi:IclR family transcriptional regulator [Anaerotignum sp. MSJ-24]|uniref:IclR family transcriptional regulator n=1 Tax=Anaerotignum sp. MSJ-24 TaxID=2841521 RepID=UPI001C0F5FEB|nr:IclR family transcriptional regulator [Anaerotignum sp. MSJ-24]MBU5464339.1 IclR family transcriptional regulator [Anaerotignum sp. MSJ-24]
MATTKTIQSLERAFSILELFQNGKPEMSLKEIADTIQLNKSTTFGLVNSLTTLGYLFQNEDNQKYSLGLKILSLTNAVKMNNILIRASRPYLEELCQKYRETVHSAQELNGSIVYIDKVDADTSMYINTQIGTKNYMHCTGVGKVLLAYKTNEELDAFLEQPLKALTFNTITNPDKLREEMKKIRDNGYGGDDEEIEIGLSCVAVPVMKSENKPGFAISVAGPTVRISEHKKNGLPEDLKKTAAKLSEIIYGYKA